MAQPLEELDFDKGSPDHDQDPIWESYGSFGRPLRKLRHSHGPPRALVNCDDLGLMISTAHSRDRLPDVAKL